MSTPFSNHEPGRAKTPDAMRARLWLAVWQEGAEQGPCANSRLTLKPPCAQWISPLADFSRAGVRNDHVLPNFPAAFSESGTLPGDWSLRTWQA